MQRYNSFISRGKRFLRDEAGGFQSLEWSLLFMVTIVVVMILLPNIITIGKNVFYSQQIAGYGIQAVAKNGQMTDAIASELETQLANAGITDYQLYGSTSGAIVPYGQPVEIDIVTTAHLFPLPSTFSYVPSKLRIMVSKVDMSTVYVRN